MSWRARFTTVTVRRLICFESVSGEVKEKFCGPLFSYEAIFDSVSLEVRKFFEDRKGGLRSRLVRRAKVILVDRLQGVVGGNSLEHDPVTL